MALAHTSSENRVPTSGCTIEYRASSKPKAGPIDHVCPLLSIGSRSVEFIAPEKLKQNNAMVLTINTPSRRSYLKLRAHVESSSKKRGEPAYRTVAVFLPYSEGMAERLRKLQNENAPPIIASVDESPEEVEEVEEPSAQPKAEEESHRELSEGQWRHQWSRLTPDARLLQWVLEAAEAGRADLPSPEDFTEGEKENASPAFMSPPVPVYRLSGPYRLDFDDEWVPRGQPLGFVSVPVKENNSCFALQLECNVQSDDDTLSLHDGDIAVFSSHALIRDKDIVLAIRSDGFELCRVRMGGEKPVALVRLNEPSSEIETETAHGVWKLVGVYQSSAAMQKPD